MQEARSVSAYLSRPNPSGTGAVQGRRQPNPCQVKEKSAAYKFDGNPSYISTSDVKIHS